MTIRFKALLVITFLFINLGCLVIFAYRAIPYWEKFTFGDSSAARINKLYFVVWIISFCIYLAWAVKNEIIKSSMKVPFLSSIAFGLAFIIVWLQGWILLF